MGKTIMQVVVEESTGFSTNRSVEQYANVFGMSKVELLRLIDGKKVLDIGASGGRFAKEVQVLKDQGELSPTTEVISLDISYSTRLGMEETHYASHSALADSAIHPSKAALNKIQANFKKRAVAASFRHLPFPDDYFDLAFANHTFGIKAVDREQLMDAFSELGRVICKDSGTGLVVVTPGDRKEELTIMDQEGRDIKYNVDDIPLPNPRLKKGYAFLGNHPMIRTYFIEVTQQTQIN